MDIKTSNRYTIYSLVWIVFVILMIASTAFAGFTIPGKGGIEDFEAAGTLLHIVDSFIFTVGARLLAGIAILAAGWNLKEQRFAMALICIFAAIMIGTVPMWVKNIFNLSQNGSIFAP